jgi:HAD superfamily hydrolase (TIGR01509 family)
MIKAILWDNDGILVDTEKFYYQATKDILARYNVELTKELYIENLLVQSRGAWHLIKNNTLPDLEIEKIRNERNRIYCEYIKQTDVLIEGVADTLKNFHKKFKMAVVTSSRKEHFDLIHSKTNLLQYFDLILTREDYKESKPNPEPYLLAVEKLNLKKNECLVIEDSERGLIAANAAGLECWVIPNELTRSLDFSLASRIFDNIKEAEKELLKLI